MGNEDIRFSVVRYGNVLNSRGSIVPLLLKLKKENKNIIPLTHKDMTRFWITLEQAANLVLKSFTMMKGGEIFVPKIPSIKILDLMKAIIPNAKFKDVGIRPGEKIHELMCPADSSFSTYEFKDFFVIFPATLDISTLKKKDLIYNKDRGRKVEEGFEYRSDNNKKFLNKNEIKRLLQYNR